MQQQRNLRSDRIVSRLDEWRRIQCVFTILNHFAEENARILEASKACSCDDSIGCGNTGITKRYCAGSHSHLNYPAHSPELFDIDELSVIRFNTGQSVS